MDSSRSRPVDLNGSYAVTVATQPKGQVCTVSNGGGTNLVVTVTEAHVACATANYTISGSVSGLASGAKLVLKDNGADALRLPANGAFEFTTPVAYDGSYAVTVSTQPAEATCSVTHGTGAGVTAAVSGVSVLCSLDTYTISGTVSGLATGSQVTLDDSGVTLDDNGADPLTLTADGAFTFATPVAYGGVYDVTVATAPSGQICAVANASGSSVFANITSVSVTCSESTVSYATPGSYNWTVPAGVTSVQIVALGAGAGGGGVGSGAGGNDTHNDSGRRRLWWRRQRCRRHRRRRGRQHRPVRKHLFRSVQRRRLRDGRGRWVDHDHAAVRARANL
jgi:hypothetical protein